MRVYLPATLRDLRADRLSARLGHAVTESLALALPEEDEEGLELSASLCAADDSVLLLSQSESSDAPDRRVVVAADVSASEVREVAVEGDVLPGTVEVTAPVAWDRVAAFLVDDPEEREEVRLAREGDEEAFERVAQADLLWFDASERAALSEGLA